MGGDKSQLWERNNVLRFLLLGRLYGAVVAYVSWKASQREQIRGHPSAETGIVIVFTGHNGIHSSAYFPHPVRALRLTVNLECIKIAHP